MQFQVAFGFSANAFALIMRHFLQDGNGFLKLHFVQRM